MSARTKARKRALDVLFEADQRGRSIERTLAERIEEPGTQVGLSEFTIRLVRGVDDERDRIDELLETYSQDWPLERMPAVDRTLLRLGTWEVLYADDTPEKVVISEYTVLATELSTDDSPRFINGLLARIVDLKPSLGA